MLSFIVRLCTAFQKEHGFSPNVVYVSAAHYSRLRSELGSHARDLGDDELRDYLGLEIMTSGDAIHPHVGWLASAARLAESA